MKKIIKKCQDKNSSLKIHIILTLVLIIILSFSLKNEVNAADANDYILPVFQTTDVHGYIAEKSGDNYQYLLSYISDKVKDVRGYGSDYNKDKALLLDSGDNYQGSTMSNLLNGQPITAAFSIMDYDAVTIGNHEFDWGIENTIDADCTMMDSNLEGFEAVNNIPVVASNLFRNNEKVSFAKDYVIIEKKATNSSGEEILVKIGVIGYLDNYSAEIMNEKFAGLGYSINEEPSIPNNIAKSLEDEELVDVTILLCHADAEETAESLGKNSVIDLVLGGHSHLNKQGNASNGIPYMEQEKHGATYGYLDLIFQKDNDEKIVFKDTENMGNIDIRDNLDKTLNIPENATELDPEMIGLTEVVVDKVKDVLNQKIGYVVEETKRKGVIEGSGKYSTTGGNWMSSVYMRAVGSDVAFTNQGGVRYDFLIPDNETKRDVTLGEIYSNYPFENKIYKYNLTYEELLQVLNYALKDEKGQAICSVVGIDCYFENEEVNALVKDGILIYQNGEWKDEWRTKNLTVATNEYVGTTDEVFKGTHNPLVEWNNASKLTIAEKVDVECAIEVLTKEANENNGLLFIDVNPHFIEGTYEEQGETSNNEDAEKENQTEAEKMQTGTVTENPQTGDNIVVWVSLILVSMLGILLCKGEWHNASNRNNCRK